MQGSSEGGGSWLRGVRGSSASVYVGVGGTGAPTYLERARIQPLPLPRLLAAPPRAAHAQHLRAAHTLGEQVGSQ